MVWNKLHSAVICLVLTIYEWNIAASLAEECTVKFAKVGCFKDRGSYNAPGGPSRPLDSLLLTDRDSSSPVFSGSTIRWRDWGRYVPDLACRCAEAAQSKGYHVFGLQYFGECWAGSRGATLHARDGKSTQCTSALNYGACADSSPLACVGNEHVNYVYTVEQGSGADVCTTPPEYASWSSWTTCSQSCENGTQVRERGCITTDGASKSKCPPDCSHLGPNLETRLCNTGACPVGNCGHFMDLAFLLDSSGSIRYKNWKKVRSFLKSLVAELGPTGEVQFSVMEYSVETKIEVKFGQYQDKEQLKGKLESLPYLRNFTRTDTALSVSVSQLFNVENGARPAPVKRVLLLVSDGKNNGKDQQVDWGQKVVQPASELRNNDVTVFALGVTDDVNMKELETIVSQPTSNHVINMNNYDDLTDAAHSFRRLICE